MSGRGASRAATTSRHGDRTQEIRNAALELFAIKGYQATTMSHIAEAVGIRAPSIYNHVGSKEELLREIIMGTLRALSEGFDEAAASSTNPAIQVSRAFMAHVRFHARHKYEAFVGTRETRNLEPDAMAEVLAESASYERKFRELIALGVESGDFKVASVHLASCALIDMGIGVSAWYDEERSTGEDTLVFHYGEWAMRLLGYEE